jgi:transposase
VRLTRVTDRRFAPPEWTADAWVLERRDPDRWGRKFRFEHPEPASGAVRSFVELGLDAAAPDHPTISRTRRLIDVETHRAVFTWVQERLVVAGLLKERTVAIDATTLEANAAMRSIVRRDTGESYQEFLTRLAAASGIKTPTREALARLDRRRKKRTSNKDWETLSDPDAKITKMKDGAFMSLSSMKRPAVSSPRGVLLVAYVSCPGRVP